LADHLSTERNVKGRIIIKSPDTDVLLLCIHFFPSMRNTKELWFKTGTVTRTKDGRHPDVWREALRTCWTNEASHGGNFVKLTPFCFAIFKRSYTYQVSRYRCSPSLHTFLSFNEEHKRTLVQNWDSYTPRDCWTNLDNRSLLKAWNSL
jgi:hypothetical protein